MIQDILLKVGLSEGEITVYTYLLEHGDSPAGTVIEETNLKRGTCYNMLRLLVEKGLVQEFEKDKKAWFRLEHPNKLKEFSSTKAADVEYANKILDTNLHSIISRYTLTHHRPGVQYVEGKQGAQMIADDLLTAQSEIYTIADIEAVEKHIHDINAAYVQKRVKLNIPKKSILIDSPFTRSFIKKNDYPHPETRILEALPEEKPLHTVTQIYDGKVSYLKLSSESIIGIIITDQDIYHTQKALFERLWNQSQPVE